MMIFEIPWKLVAWFIPYLIVNNSASILVTFITWYKVLTTGLLWMWTWAIDIATSHLILASVMTRGLKEFSEDAITKLLSWCMWDTKLSSLCLLKKWKEKQLEKVLIILELGKNSELWASKEGKTLLNLLVISMIGPLIFSC